MLIFEPKPYPKLSPKNGDTVFDYFTKETIGEVSKIHYNSNIEIKNIDGSSWIYEPSGISYEWEMNICAELFKWFRINPKPRNKIFDPITNRIEIQSKQ
jgi:hypothetical protein